MCLHDCNTTRLRCVGFFSTLLPPCLLGSRAHAHPPTHAYTHAHAYTSNRWPTATGSCKVKLEPSAPLTAPTDVDVLCLLSAYCTCVSQRRSPLKPRRACDALIPALILSEAGESRGKKAARLPVPSPLSPHLLESDTRGSQQRRRCRGAFYWQSTDRGCGKLLKHQNIAALKLRDVDNRHDFVPRHRE